MKLAAETIFWLSAAALVYTYAGYPLLLLIMSRLRPREVRRGEVEPAVSVIITAYNEGRDLAAKLENTLMLDYPRELLEIIVASDCSTDSTDEIARTFAARGVRLVRQPQRLGKTAAQNMAVAEARGEIILFSDATSLYEPNVLRVMMPSFADPTVGCVAGRLIYVDPADSRIGRGARSYWGYETFLKEHESRIFSLIGASGCLYAVRRSAYVPLYAEACSDFIIATKMVEQNLRAVYEPTAVCTEETNRQSDKELKMRVRVIAQTFTDLWRHRAMMNPFRSGFYAVQLLSHKVMRYTVPLFLIAILATSAILARHSMLYSIVFVAQVGCYLSALGAWLLERAGVHSRMLALPQYFVLSNLAALMAFYQFLRGERYAHWETNRESASTRLAPPTIAPPEVRGRLGLRKDQMCGIAGFVSRDEHRDPREARAVLDGMCRVIAHRGPDDQGMLVEDRVALGMRRLSIIDVTGGRQPMSGCDGAATIVFNGEIYNYRDLQCELESRGHRFKTHSDTETIGHAYEEYGARCVDHLRGMFAFAIWDARARELFIARDRVGKKPLYYTVTPGGTLIFGSELKSLREHPEFRGQISVEALDAYLTFGYVPDPLTIFQDVHKLPPGHHLTFKDGRVNVAQYWDFPYEHAQEDPVRSEDECLEELRALLDESVRIRLESEVPLGAFLSGGVDSSTVVGLMARHATQPVKTFSIGFHEDSYNELKYARMAAEAFGTDHHEFIVTPDICDIVDELVWHFDEPFADSSAIPTYMVSKLARQHVTVALSGDGGDELFAGYTRYALDRKRSGFASLPRVVRHGVMQPLGRNLPHGAWGRNYLHNVALDPLDRYIEEVSVFTRLNKPSLYTEDFRQQLGTGEAAQRFRDYAAHSRANDPLDPLLYLDSKTYLPGDILTKVDRMSMAVSLEARVPLLDHKLIEFVCTRIPASMKMKGLNTKHIFKRAICDLVPTEILDRPKQGFGIPIDRWINEQLRERVRGTLTEPRTMQRGFTEPRYVKLLLDEHERGRRDHATELWALFMLELWHRKFVDDIRQTPGLDRGLVVSEPGAVATGSAANLSL